MVMPIKTAAVGYQRLKAREVEVRRLAKAALFFSCDLDLQATLSAVGG